MKAMGTIRDMWKGIDGFMIVTLSIPMRFAAWVEKLMGCELDIGMEKHREKRSQSQNAYAWELISQIAQSLDPPIRREDVYFDMLRHYGQGEMVSFRKDRQNEVLRAFDYYEIKGEGQVNGKQFVHAMVYVGSSKYNTLEMSKLISGIVEEAKDLGIETLTPDELAKLEAS